jgi:signal transduction histidine kinase
LKFYYSLGDQAEYWKETGNLLSVSLNNLSGGTHTLRIKKEEGISEPVIHVISFDIEKKFVETTFFKLLVVALVFFVVYLLFKARLHQLTNERTRLEKEVSERTKDQAQLITQLKDSIADLTQLQQELSQLISHKENVIAILIHDIKSPLNFLASVANHLETDFETNSFEKNKEIIKEVSKKP